VRYSTLDTHARLLGLPRLRHHCVTRPQERGSLPLQCHANSKIDCKDGDATRPAARGRAAQSQSHPHSGGQPGQGTCMWTSTLIAALLTVQSLHYKVTRQPRACLRLPDTMARRDEYVSCWHRTGPAARRQRRREAVVDRGPAAGAQGGERRGHRGHHDALAP
jgi:hypothetical protein